MLKGIKSLFQGGSANGIDLSGPGLKFLKNDLARLDQVQRGLGARAIRYVFLGENEEVLLEIRGTGKAAFSALRMHSGGYWGRRGKKNTDRRIYFDQRKPNEGPLLHRLGEVFAAAWSGHGVGSDRLWSRLPDRMLWLEALAREAVDRGPMNRGRRHPKPVLWAEELEDALRAAGESADWLVKVAFMEEASYGYAYFRRQYVDQIAGMADAYARHPEALAEILESSAAAHRVYVVETLTASGAAVDGELRSCLERLWVGSAKTVREAVERLVSGDRERRDDWLGALKRFSVDGTAAQRRQAVQAFGRLAPEAAAEFLADRLDADKSKRVRAEIERILGTTPSAAETSGDADGGAVTHYDDELVVPEAKIYDQAVEVPADFEAQLIERFERFNERANTLHEQNWDRMDPRWRRGKRSLPAQVDAKHARAITRRLAAADEIDKPVVNLQRMAYNHLIIQEVGEQVAASGFSLVGLLRLGFLLGLGGNGEVRGYYRPRPDSSFLDWIQAYKASREPDLSLLNLQSACSAAKVPGDWVELLYLDWTYNFSPNPLGLGDDGIWPYFVHRTEGLAAALGLADSKKYQPQSWMVNDWKLRAYEVLKTFPRPPRRFVGYLWEQALGTSKTERPLAQACLHGYPNREVPVIAALKDGRKDIRAAAADWLAEIGTDEAVAPLRKALGKEKYDEPKAAMMAALEALGVDIDQFLNRKKLLDEAQKGLAKALPKDLEWFPFDQLPTVHWEKNRQQVPDEILRWFVVQSFRLKSPDPNPLLRRYASLMRPDERRKLGMAVLSAWLHQDTLPRYDHAEASKLADQQVAQQKQWAAKWPESYAKDFDEDAVRKRALSYLLNECKGSATSSKGVLALAAACCGVEAVAPVQSYLKQWYGHRLHQCKALVRMLSWIEHPLAIQAILAVATRFRTKGIQKEAAACVDEIAERRGWSRDELADRTIPAAGFESDGTQVFDYGAREFSAKLAEDFSIQLFNPDGKQIKSLPKAAQADDDDLVKAAKKQLTANRKELKQVLTLQRERLYEAMCVERRWRFEDWELYLLQHPIVGRYCQRLVWLAERGDHSIVSFRPLPDLTLSDCDDETVELAADDEVRIAHQSLLDADSASAWLEHLGDYEVEPLFRQFASDVYVVDEAAKESTEIGDFEGHLVNSFKLRSRTGKLGYTRGPAEDGGWFHTYLKTFPSLRLQAVIEFTGNILPEENRTVALQRAYFIEQQRQGADEWTWSHRPLKLKKIPQILAAETYSDLKTMSSDGSGYDPEWSRKTQW